MTTRREFLKIGMIVLTGLLNPKATWQAITKNDEVLQFGNIGPEGGYVQHYTPLWLWLRRGAGRWYCCEETPPGHDTIDLNTEIVFHTGAVECDMTISGFELWNDNKCIVSKDLEPWPLHLMAGDTLQINYNKGTNETEI